MGSDIYCTLQLQKIVEQILGDVQHTAEFLSGERHSFWSALRCSIAHRLDYWLQTSYLSVVEPIATWLDSELWKFLKAATGLLIPRTTTNTAWDCVLPVPVAGREARSFQDWVVRLPVKLGGFGFRSMKDTASLAFIGALEQAIPAFQGERGVCPQLADLLGGQECFGEDAVGNRWRVMLGSGSREGLEISAG